MTKINLKDYNMEDKELLAISYYNRAFEIVVYILSILMLIFVGLTAYCVCLDFKPEFVVVYVFAGIFSILDFVIMIAQPKSLLRLQEPRTVLAYNKEKERIVICFKNGKVTETYAKTLSKICYNNVHLVVNQHIFLGKIMRTTYSSAENSDGSGKIKFKYIDNKKVNRRFKAHVEWVKGVYANLVDIVKEAKNIEGK